MELFEVAMCSTKSTFQAYATDWLQARVGFDGLVWGKGTVALGAINISDYRLEGRPAGLILDYPSSATADPVSTRFIAAPHSLQNISTHAHYQTPALQIMRDYLECYRIRQLQIAGLRHPDTCTYGWLVFYREEEHRPFTPGDECAAMTAVPLVLAAQYLQDCIGNSALMQLRGHSAAGGKSVDPELTVRQQQVLGMLELGMPNKVIAKHLCISENTLKTHLKSIYERLGVRSRTQALLKCRA